MDNRSPEDIRKSIKSLVEEAENVPIDDESPKIESGEKAAIKLQKKQFT